MHTVFCVLILFIIFFYSNCSFKIPVCFSAKTYFLHQVNLFSPSQQSVLLKVYWIPHVYFLDYLFEPLNSFYAVDQLSNLDNIDSREKYKFWGIFR